MSNLISAIGKCGIILGIMYGASNLEPIYAGKLPEKEIRKQTTTSPKKENLNLIMRNYYKGSYFTRVVRESLPDGTEIELEKTKKANGEKSNKLTKHGNGDYVSYSGGSLSDKYDGLVGFIFRSNEYGEGSIYRDRNFVTFKNDFLNADKEMRKANEKYAEQFADF